MKNNYNLEQVKNFRQRVLTFCCSLAMVLLTISAWGQTTVPFTSSGTWTVPAGVTQVTLEAIGGGGGGGGVYNESFKASAGGGGGAYAKKTIAVTPGTVLTITVGSGGDGLYISSAPGGDSKVSVGSTTYLLAKGGGGVTYNITGSFLGEPRAGYATGYGAGGQASECVGDVAYSGGNGGLGNSSSTRTSNNGGGGGGAAGRTGNGNNGGNATSSAVGTGGTGNTPGGNGANGASVGHDGTSGSNYGGGGSGAARGTIGSQSGGKGASGVVYITYTVCNANVGTLAVSNNATICNGSSTTLTVSTTGNTGTMSYSWSPATGLNATTGSSVTASPSTTTTTTTTYTVTATATVSESCTATATKSVTVTVNPLPTLSEPSNKTQTVCAGNAIEDITFTYTNATSIQVSGLPAGLSLSGNKITGTPTASGTYTVTTVNENGCTNASVQGTITINNPQITLNDLADQTICDGSSTTLTASVASSNGTVTYAWSNGLGTNATSGSITASGTYTVTATATIGSCTKTDSKSATVSIYPTFSAGAIATTGQQRCYGDGSNSQIGSTTAATGGDGNISYQWQLNGADIAGATSATYTPTQTEPGTYTFTRKAKDGSCADWTASTGSYTLTIYALPTLDEPSNRTQTVCAGNAIEDITFTYTNATSIQVSGLPAGLSLSGNKITGTPTASGTYTVTTVNENGCTNASVQGTITINNPQITLNDLEGKTICDGSSATLTASVASSNGTVTYAWSNGLGTNATSGSITSSGTYTVTATATIGSCTKTDSKSATVSIYPTFSAGAIATTGQQRCYGDGSNSQIGSTTAAEGGDGNISYQWQLNGADIAGATSATYTPTQTEPGTYTFTRKAKDGSCADWTASTGSYTLTIYALPTLDEPSNRTQTVCAGNAIEDITFTYTNATSIQVSGLPAGLSLSGNKITGTPTASGTYTVTTVNKNGCTNASVQGTITINNPQITLNDLEGKTICDGSSTTLTASVASSNGTVTYAWSDDLGTNATSGSITSSGTYSVTATATIGSCTKTDSKSAEVSIYPTFSAGAIATTGQQRCYGDGSNSQIGSTTAAEGGDGSISYQWQLNGADIAGATSATYTPTQTAVGEYTFTRKAKDGSCAGWTQSTGEWVLTINEFPTITVTPTDVLCNGGSTGKLAVAISGGTPSYTIYNNSTSAGTLSAAGTFNIENLAAGNYTVSVTDNNGCSVTADSKTISQPEPLTISIDSHTDVSCHNGDDATFTITISGGTPMSNGKYLVAVDRRYYSGGSLQDNLSAGTHTISSPWGFPAGEYQIHISDGNGCYSSNQYVTVTQPNELNATVTSQTDVLCKGAKTGSVTVTATEGTAPYQYKLSTQDETAYSATNTFSNLAAGDYTVNVKDAHGCTKDVAVTITEPESLPTVTVNNANICLGQQSATLTATVSSDITEYLWSNGETTSSITVAPSTGRAYTVTVTNGNGCTATATGNVGIYAIPQVAITPIANDLCPNIGTKELTATITSATVAPYTYTWSGDLTVNDAAISGTTISGTATIPTDCNANYTVQLDVTDANGCTAQGTTTITVKDITKPGIGHNIPSSLIDAVPAANCTYTIPDLTAHITGIDNCSSTACAKTQEPAAGTPITATQWVKAIVTDGCGNSNYTNIRVIVPDALALTENTHTDISCYEGSDGSITVNAATGGTAPYTYAIDGGTAGENKTFSGLAAGEHTITVYDNNGCSKDLKVTLTQPAQLTLTLTPTEETCTGHDGKIQTTVNGGTTPYSYTWSNGHNTASCDTLTSLVNGGVYTVTVTDSKGCKATDDVTITLNNPLAMEPITGPTRCTGTEFSITPQNGTNGVIPDGTVYSWPAPTATGVTGLEASDGYEQRIHGILTNTTSSPVQVTYTVTPKVGVCVGNAVGVTVTVTTTVNPNVTVTMPNALTKCANADNFPIEATFVNSNSAATAVWKLGDETVATHNLSADTHTDSYTVDLPNDVCQGQYNYHVYYTDESGCTADDECVITVNAGEWSIDNTTYPNGSANVECVSAATDPSSFAPTGAQILDGCGRTTTRTLYSTVTTPNPIVCEGTVTYTYRYTACDDSHNDWTYTYNVKDVTVPVFADDILTTKPADIDQSQCKFTVPDLTADVRAKVSDNCTAAADLVITQNPAAGTVITAATDVVVTVKDKCDKQNTHTVNVTVPTLPTVILSAGVVDCKGNATGSATVTASNGTPGYTYLWSNGETTATITDLTAGEYSVTVTDANGCKVDDQIEVTEPDELEVAIASTDNKTAICYGGNLDLTATAEGGNGTYTYAWTNSTETDNSINVAPTTTTTYTVTVTDAKNCTATGNFLLTVNSLPVISISDVDPLCPTIGTQELTATLTTTSATPYRYAWSGDLPVTPATTPATPLSIPEPYDEQILHSPAGTNETSNTVSATIPTACGEDYAVTVTVTDANGCTATDNATVSVKTPVKPTIAVATNSNPNGDCNPESITAPTFTVTDECDATATAVVTTEGPQGDSYEKTQTWTATYTNICGTTAEPVEVTYNWIEDHTAPRFKPGKHWSFPSKTDMDICISDCPAFPTKEEVAALFEDENSGDILPEQVEVRYDTIPVRNLECHWYIYAYYSIKDACGNKTDEWPIIYNGVDQSAPRLIHEWPADITGIEACKAAGTENYEDVYDLLDAHFDIQPNVSSYFEDCAAITVRDHFDSVTGDDCAWNITRFFPVEDACGNKDTLKVMVSGGDHTVPTFTAPANTTIYCKSSCSFDVNVDKTGDVTNEWDNCSTGIQATRIDNDLTRDDCGGWILKRKWSLEDNCHNKAEDQIQVITILDTVAPVMAEGKTWPADISNHNSCYAARPDFPTISDIAVLFYDSCSQDILEANVSYEDKNITENNCGWSITREYTIKDKCNNATVKSITYSGSDQTAPVLSGIWPDNITGKNSCLADADLSVLKSDEYIASLYTDCGKVTVTHNDVSTGNDCEWTVTRTYTVKDTCNNQVTPSPTMSVSGGDHIKPTFTAPADITIERRANCGYDFSPTATGDVTDEADNCSTGLEAYSSYNRGEDELGYDVPAGIATLTRTWYLEDNCGNAAAPQIQVITIIDVTAPELIDPGTWPANITNQNACFSTIATSGLLTDAQAKALYMDCNLFNVTHQDVVTGNNCNWTVTRTYTIKDVAGNTVTPAPTMSVSGGDLTAPVMKQSAVWPSNISNYNSCYAGKPAFPTNAEIAALFTDACSGDVVETNVSYEDKDITNYNCGWTITREYTIEDACGNAVSPKPTITYSGNDQDAPTLTVPGSWPSNFTNQDNCLANADKSGLKSNEYIKELFSDCGPIVVTSKDDTTGNNCAWTITRTYTIADMCGNTYKTWGDVLPTMSVSGGDQTAPVLKPDAVWPSDKDNINTCFAGRPAFPTTHEIAELFTDECSGEIPYTNVSFTENATATDDCNWSITRTYNIMDACENVLTPKPTITYSGSDQTDPTIVCESDITTNTDTDKDYATITLSNPTYSDNCGATYAITYSPAAPTNATTSNASGLYPMGTTTVTYTATDECGNTSSCSFDVTVGDNQAPDITCPSTITVECIDEVPAAYADYTEFTAAGGSATDNAAIVPSTFALVSNVSDGNTCPETITRTYTIKDNSGLSNNCTQKVIVKDVTAPTFTAPADITLCRTAAGAISALVATTGEPTDVADNCTAAPTVTWTDLDTTGTDIEIRTIRRQWTVADDCGNELVKVQNISILPSVLVSGAIYLTCPNDTSAVLFYGATDTLIDVTAPTVVNNMTGTNITVTRVPAVGYRFPVGTTTVTWTIADDNACGYTVTCTQNVTVSLPSCGGPTDSAYIDGYAYSSVRIGYQCWTGENLRHTHYADNSAVNPAGYANYDNDPANDEAFGILYSWYAAVGLPEPAPVRAAVRSRGAEPTRDGAPIVPPHTRGICPEGWGIPTAEDYSIMIATSGGVEYTLSPDTHYWLPSHTGTIPATGVSFLARGAGYWDSVTETFNMLLVNTNFWTSDSAANSSSAICVELGGMCNSENYVECLKGRKVSVRCIKLNE